MSQDVFGPGASAGWITLFYLVAGVLGTVGRVLLSPVLDNRGTRMIVEAISGGAAGILMPYLGAAVFPASAAALPPIAKAALIVLLTASSSFTVGEILARFKGA